jgi:hypothetical protein
MRPRAIPPSISEQARVLRAAVCRNLGSTWAARIRWSTSKVPTIDNIEILTD